MARRYIRTAPSPSTYDQIAAGYAATWAASTPQAATTVPSVVYNPGYWNTARGRDELRQREQAENQQRMREAVGEAERSAQVVQIGSHVLTTDERRSRQDVAIALRDAYASAQAAGSFSLAITQHLTAASLRDSFEERRRMRQSARLVDAVRSGYENGSLTLNQASNATQQLVSHYGMGTLLNTPGFAGLVGLNKQLKVAQDSEVAAFSRKYGVEAVWDSESGRPTIDKTKYIADTLNAQQRGANTELMIEPIKAQAGYVNSLATTIGEKPNAEDAQLLRREQFKLLKMQRDFARAAGFSSETLNAEPSKTTVTIQAGSPLPTFSRSRPEELRAADLQPGAPILIDGVLSTITNDGRVVPLGQRSNAASATQFGPDLRYAPSAQSVGGF